jgi:XTP/dITP diphosphohydrolase
MQNSSLVVNHLVIEESGNFIDNIPFYPDYQEKLNEVRRISKKNLLIKEFKIDEIQDSDPVSVVKQKAFDAWRLNGCFPVLVEDTSLFISSFNGLPGPYVSSFTEFPEQRKIICEVAKQRSDLRIKAKALIATFNGEDFSVWEGTCNGIIPEKPRGSKGFGWDDIFIPEEAIKNGKKTFAEMKPEEKDSYSMRAKAWNNFLESDYEYRHPVHMLPEPYSQEMERIRYSEITKRARKFAYNLESIEKVNKPSYYFIANKYIPLIREENSFYRRYSTNHDSPSLGIILTNIDLERVRGETLDEPKLWQLGPKRRTLALAQRAHFFDQNQNRVVQNILKMFENGKITVPARSNRPIRAVEKALGFTTKHKIATHTPALTELGYKKISSPKRISRRKILESGLFNKIGKYPRKIIGLGSMPPTTGWRDTLVTAAVGHLVCFIPRNSIFAGNIKRRVELAKSVKTTIDNLPIPEGWKSRAKRNIGASVGLDDPKEELKIVRELYRSAGIKLFRIYTIGADLRVIEAASLLRKEFGNEIEIFVGQIADKKQAEKLIDSKICVDGLIFGHGGGQQCTSAINGMAITTLEDLYEIILDKDFNATSLIVEGGIDRSIGTALLLGVDCCLGNQKMVRGTIETGGFFVESINGKIGQPYPGSASPVTQIIESEYEHIRSRRTDPSGRTYNAEGKPGFMNYEKKANSMSFWINEHLSYAARTLADLGVESVAELRTLLEKDPRQFLRAMSEKTQYLSDAYGNYN